MSIKLLKDYILCVYIKYTFIFNVKFLYHEVVE